MCLGDNSTLVCEDLHENAGNPVTITFFSGFVWYICYNSASDFFASITITFVYIRSSYLSAQTLDPLILFSLLPVYVYIILIGLKD